MARLRALYPQGSKFKRFAQAMAKVSDEGTMRFTSEGGTFWIFSPDKTVLSIVTLPVNVFDEFEAQPEEGVILDVNLNELYKVSRRATRNDKLLFQYDSGSPGLTVELQDSKTSFSRSFVVTASEVSEQEFREISMNPTAKLTLTADDLGVLIADAKFVGDVVQLHAVDDKLEVIASAEGKEYLWIMKLGEPLQELTVSEETRASYSTKSLYSSLKPIVSLADTVTLEFSTDYPLKITANTESAEKVVIYVAPVQS